MDVPGASWSKGPKHGKLRAESLECLRNKICVGLEGLASAWMLCPHGLLVPYFESTRLGGGPAGACGNNAQKEKQEYLMILDILGVTWVYLILWLRNTN